jgi:inhibitor of KinA
MSSATCYLIVIKYYLPFMGASFSIFPLGDAALVIDFGNVIDPAINKKVLRLFRKFQLADLPYIIDLVPSYSSLGVHYDPVAVLRSSQDEETAFDHMAQLAGEMIVQKEDEDVLQTRNIEIPVCYSPRFAPDIEALAQSRKMSVEELVSIHTSGTYRVYMLGFLPGFPYMGEVDERIAAPRLDTPRKDVPAGSVGIAGRQTGIYPLTSPGGWRIIGRTPIKIFNSNSDQPAYFEPGDEVNFISITEDEFENIKGRHT